MYNLLVGIQEGKRGKDSSEAARGKVKSENRFTAQWRPAVQNVAKFLSSAPSLGRHRGERLRQFITRLPARDARVGAPLVAGAFGKSCGIYRG